MKPPESNNVIVNLEMWHVERIWTEFRNDTEHKDIATIFETARQDAL
jgi:hypothetical protein